jgi:hypothetical protein
MPINTATISTNKLISFSGLLITTTINNTITARNLINKNTTKLVFYVWDLEWLRAGQNNFLHNIQAYRAPDMLIARSTEHVYPITNYSNRQPIVIEDFLQVPQCLT